MILSIAIWIQDRRTTTLNNNKSLTQMLDKSKDGTRQHNKRMVIATQIRSTL